MHGRVKVRTTEEERERKKKEQALKVKAYKYGMSKIQAKREKQELDDEMQQLSAQILLRNPDLTTLWNVRRECVLQKATELQEDEPAQQAMYDAELLLTEQCLMVNPKSYGAWHHRRWSLEHSPSTNWEREVQLCKKYLKLDERNFHTWDYRRYVVEKAGVPKQEDLDFCTEKIKANFSNYSSWHHRSHLLPVLYPYEGEETPKLAMSETKLKEELEMVLTAAFTDPNDSSAWFYQRWLLGYTRPTLEIGAFRCDQEKAVLAFAHPTAAQELKVILSDTTGENCIELLKWSALDGGKVDSVWLAAMPKHNLNFAALKEPQIKVHVPDLPEQVLALKLCKANENLFGFKAPNRSFAFSPAVLTELQSQLESCNSLLEFEPDSKWTLLTAALLMRAIDRQQYHGKSLEYIEKLQKVDGLRVEYYKDLASKWLLEKLLTDWSMSTDIPKQLNLEAVPQLGCIYYPQYLCIVDELVLSAELRARYAEPHGKLRTYAELKLENK